MFSKMTQADRQRAIDAGIIKGKKKKTSSTPKKTNWSLTWTYCGQTQTIVSNKPYAYCVVVRKNKSKEISFKNGKFEIK